MSLYLASVPNPAPGHDWTYTVPGQYVEDLISVTATLATGAPVTTFPDETGNGHTMNVALGSQYSLGAPGPYGGGLNNYGAAGRGLTTDPAARIADDGTGAVFSLLSGTLECWVYVPTQAAGTITDNGFGIRDVAASTVRTGLGVHSNTHSPADLDIVGNGFQITVATGVVPRDAWHLIAGTWNGTNWLTYVDGMLVNTHSGNQPTANANPSPWCGGSCVAGNMHGRQGGAAIYGSALAAANLLAHFNAATSWSAYRTAVLADTPIAFWGENTVSAGPSRTPSLKIANGQQTVGLFTAGVAAGGSAPNFTYSWLNNLSSNVQPSGTSTITAAIPDMVLPAGYTIGSSTPDIQSTDQWSNIVIWWDSNYMDNVHNFQPFVYPPGACLQYKQVMP